MIRDVVRTLTIVAATLCLSAMSCEEPLGPEGLVTPGDYRLIRPIADAEWEVPSPLGSEAGCGQLLDARLLIGENGSVLHTRTIRRVQNGVPVTSDEELRPTLEKYRSGQDTQLQYRGWYDVIREQREPTADDPTFTVLYVDQYFRGNSYCPTRRVMLRYTIGGVTH